PPSSRTLTWCLPPRRAPGGRATGPHRGRCQPPGRRPGARTATGSRAGRASGPPRARRTRHRGSDPGCERSVCRPWAHVDPYAVALTTPLWLAGEGEDLTDQVERSANQDVALGAGELFRPGEAGH